MGKDISKANKIIIGLLVLILFVVACS